MEYKVYVANLPERIDRKKSIQNQFNGRSEFQVQIISALKHKIGAKGLWETFIGILKREIESNSPYFIFCEDDHVFTEDYNKEFFDKQVFQAQEYGADLLSGGVSWMKNPIQCSENLFWISHFTANQFIVVFRSLYQKIMEINDDSQYFVLDRKLSDLSDNAFVTYPFISIQKEFGYSDATPYNNETPGFVDYLFHRERERVKILNKVKNYYVMQSYEK